MEEENIYPIKFVGYMSLMNAGGLDVGSLEGRDGTPSLLSGIAVMKSAYECYYAIREDGRGVGAMMLVSTSYGRDTLEATEKIGEFTVGLSNIVGFFSSPKKEYTLKQLAEYVGQLEKEHAGLGLWTSLNSRQFLAPASQPAATFVSVYAHRNGFGEIDAIQMEFNRKESALLEQGGTING